MCLPKLDIPEKRPLMPSSQMPPTESVRDSRLVVAFQYPTSNPSAVLLTLVEPRRSAAAIMSAPSLLWL